MKVTLLIADGDTRLCDIYRSFFMDHGYDVVTATGGLDCLAKLRQVKPHVLILDLDLRWGGTDGILACLQDECRGNGTPAVFLTGGASAYPFPQFGSQAVVKYLAKPFFFAVLLESIRAATG